VEEESAQTKNSSKGSVNVNRQARQAWQVAADDPEEGVCVDKFRRCAVWSCDCAGCVEWGSARQGKRVCGITIA